MPLTPVLKRLFDGPNFAHVATLMADGSPQVTPVWIGTEGERIIFYKEEKAIAYRNLRRDPRIAISIVAVDNPYLGGFVRGEVVEFRSGPEAPEWLSRMAEFYSGKPYPPEYLEHVTPGALLVVEPARQHDYDVVYMQHSPQHPIV